jgi:hypothetical protein
MLSETGSMSNTINLVIYLNLDQIIAGLQMHVHSMYVPANCGLLIKQVRYIESFLAQYGTIGNRSQERIFH